MLATSIAVPGDSFVLIWPLLFATLAIGYRARVANQRKTLGLAILALVALIPGITMIVPGSDSVWNDLSFLLPTASRSHCCSACSSRTSTF